MTEPPMQLTLTDTPAIAIDGHHTHRTAYERALARELDDEADDAERLALRHDRIAKGSPSSRPAMPASIIEAREHAKVLREYASELRERARVLRQRRR